MNALSETFARCMAVSCTQQVRKIWLLSTVIALVGCYEGLMIPFATLCAVTSVLKTNYLVTQSVVPEAACKAVFPVSGASSRSYGTCKCSDERCATLPNKQALSLCVATHDPCPSHTLPQPCMQKFNHHG